MPDATSNAITPLILTHDEAPNVGRVLDRLAWAERIVVVDSGSTGRRERSENDAAGPA